LPGAGGIGGLVSVTQYGNGITSYLPAYDANGNVMAMIRADTGTVEARYDYSPFGRTFTSTGSYAASNPIRFSTKYCDNETGLLYFGYRYYNNEMGRWVTRDPIEEVRRWCGRCSENRGNCSCSGGSFEVCRQISRVKAISVFGGNLYVILSNQPVTSTDPYGLVKDGKDCGIEKWQTPFCILGGSPPNNLGHTWLTWGGSDGGYADFPAGWIESHPCEKEHKYINNKWNTVGRAAGVLQSLDANPKPCRCATCGDIKNCLGRMMAYWNANRPWNKTDGSCRAFVDDAIQKCCLKQSRLFYVNALAPITFCFSDCAKGDGSQPE
jgi:RHS repeat-associated protein